MCAHTPSHAPTKRRRAFARESAACKVLRSQGMAVISRNFAEWLRAAPAHPGTAPGSPQSNIPRVLQRGGLRCVYQPLIELDTGRVFAYEALARSSSPHWESASSLFVDAVRGRVCGALGRALRELAVDGCRSHPLFLNVHPHEFDEGWLVQPDDPIFEHAHPVYLEITESVPLSHFSFCHSVLRELRNRGMLLAVDDLGAGYSNLRYIADLAPDIVKLDSSLVADLATDERVRRLVCHIVRLCEDLGARVVAEGIETEGQASAAIDVGVHFGQGFYFARPSYPPPPFFSARFVK